eukprot:GFUD01006812.1.p1 GENE.GFUD01006812.1~~GFUD01006812.1.p1  ORF type:complete len:186 (+),score=63.11 GFUD01006812.1:188-745(+)
MAREPTGFQRTFVDSYIYTCDMCGKTPESRSQLKVHLAEDHDDVDASEKDLDGPPYRIRRLQLYQMKLERLEVNLEHLSIVDVIEVPWLEVFPLVENLNEKQQQLCLDIRETDREQGCQSDRKHSQISDSGGLEDTREGEYQQLQAAVAQKRDEYQSNLKINEEKEKELAYWRKKVSETKHFSDS